MYPVIEPAERAVLEEKLRTVFGSGAATTALLKIIDAVNFVGYLDPPLAVGVEEPAPEVTPEVQVVESSP
jgi:hypothetical protein